MRILVCYDGSQSARHALTVARAAVGDAHATVLNVWEPPPPFLADSFSTTAEAGPSAGELDRVALRHAREIAQEGSDLARSLGLDTDIRVGERDGHETWRTILAVADEVDADLIVVGTRGTTAVQSSLLGSVSHGVVQHSGRPVLVVPTPAAA